MDLLWSCYSNSYQEHLSGGRQAWEADWAKRTPSEIADEMGRQIAEERVIDESVAYLLFELSTLPSSEASPFFYLVRQEDGWFLTSHLDGLFHSRLEQALENGALKLPPP
jgi:hypothetical protein